MLIFWICARYRSSFRPAIKLHSMQTMQLYLLLLAKKLWVKQRRRRFYLHTFIKRDNLDNTIQWVETVSNISISCIFIFTRYVHIWGLYNSLYNDTVLIKMFQTYLYENVQKLTGRISTHFRSSFVQIQINLKKCKKVRVRVRSAKIEVRCGCACETIMKVRVCVQHTVKFLATQHLVRSDIRSSLIYLLHQILSDLWMFPYLILKIANIQSSLLKNS